MANNQLAQKQIPPSKTTGRPQRRPKQRPTSQESSLLREARSDRPRKNHAPKMRVNPVILLIQKHPLLIWSTLWAAMLAAGGLAILGLTNPGHVEKVDSLPETTTTQSTVLQEQTNGETPAWIYGAIAIGCATGGWVTIKQLKGYRRRRLLRQPLKQRPTSRQSVPRQRQKAVTPTSQQAPNRKRLTKSSARKPPVPPSQIKIAVGQTQLPYSDESQNKLANSMDMRKRQPLSSLLRNR